MPGPMQRGRGAGGFRTQSRVYEELVVAIDAAGVVGADDMEGVADVQPRAPQWARGIENIGVSASCNGDALGSGVAFAIIQGSAFPHGPHHIPLAGFGGEVVIERNDAIASEQLVDMGIVVQPGGEYIVQFEAVGEDGGEVGSQIELTFQNRPVRQPKQWIAREGQIAALAGDALLATLAQVQQSIDCGPSRLIDGVIMVMGADMAGLGCASGTIKLSQGTVDEQHFNAGSWGGELIVGDGDLTPPTQRVNAGILLKGGENVYCEGRMTNEDGGTISLGVAVGVAR